jgi:hypothetical protein
LQKTGLSGKSKNKDTAVVAAVLFGRKVPQSGHLLISLVFTMGPQAMQIAGPCNFGLSASADCCSAAAVIAMDALLEENKGTMMIVVCSDFQQS